MHRLFPLPSGPTDVEKAYAGPLGAHVGRPWVALSMIQSLDGSSVVDGRSATMSNATDQSIYRRLRALADVVLVGASTAHLEGYSPSPRPDQRIGVVTRGSVDTSTPLFQSGSGFVVTTNDAEFEECGVDVVRSGTTDVDLRGALQAIGRLCDDPQYVLVEGGPQLNGSFVDDDLFDEINLTTSAVLAGGSGPRIVERAAQHAHRFELSHLAIDDDSFVMGRWRRRRDRSVASSDNDDRNRR